jgi:hypothetical protein
MEFDVWGRYDDDLITDDEHILKSFENVADAIAYAKQNTLATAVLSNVTGHEHWSYFANYRRI